MKEKRLLDIKDVAEALGSLRAAQRVLRSGDLKARKIGRDWKVRPKDLEAWIERKFDHEDELRAA